MQNGLRLSRLIRAKFQDKLTKFHYYKDIAFSRKFLLYTNVCISISLSGCGDILEQHYEILTGQLEIWDRQRTHNMSVTGMTIGIICHNWYRWLDRRFPQRTIRTVLKKVVIDQMICSPICISTFFLTLAFLEKSTYKEFVDNVKEKAHRLYIAEWVVWPPAQVINFYFLPNRYRVLYDNTISLGYDVYTSYVQHNRRGS